MCTCVQVLKEARRGPKAGVTGRCEAPNMGAGKQTQVL